MCMLALLMIIGTQSLLLGFMKESRWPKGIQIVGRAYSHANYVIVIEIGNFLKKKKSVC